MKVSFSLYFIRRYHKAPQERQRQFNKQLGFLLQDLRHPSLRAKIVDQEKRIWQARVDGGWRFHFQIKNNIYYLLEIGPHPKTKPPS